MPGGKNGISVGKAERRISPRHSCYLEATCEIPEGSPPATVCCPATVMNLSLHGASVAVSRQFERGTTLFLKVPNTTKAFWCGRLSQVAYVRRLPPSHWMLGCKFNTPLGDDELHTLLGNTAGPERRRFRRYVPHPLTAHNLDINLDGHDAAVRIQNVSRGGLCLLSDRAFARGTRLHLELANRISGARCAVSFRVVHLRTHESGGWVLGGAWVSKVDAADLVALLS
jgi:hypothetical protein